jgi:predicted NUDIX family phosphoesterase
VSEELVLVVPRAEALPDGGWHGLRRDVGLADVTRLEASGAYRPRSLVEPDPDLKQLIPYVVVRSVDRWFLMKRTRAGGDARLHDRYSIGVGGHVNPGDDGVLGGLRREWEEELVAPAVPEFHLVGLLNDDTTEVGSVHLGVVFEADVPAGDVSIRETDKLSARWASDAEVRTVHPDLETWSQIVFDSLAGGR